MTLGDIDTDLRHQGIGRSKLGDRVRRHRELTDAQQTDTELSDTDNATRELSDSDDATCHDWSSVGPVLERDVDERQARNRDFRLVLVAPAVPCLASWIRSTALWAGECLLRDVVCAFATRLHRPLSVWRDVITASIRLSSSRPMRDEGGLRNISDTAHWVAMYRALESERPDALFRDPFARRAAGGAGAPLSAGPNI